MEKLAIRVYKDEEKTVAAVKYFESLGYPNPDKCENSGRLPEYVVTYRPGWNNEQDWKISFSDGSYANECRLLDLVTKVQEPELSQLRVGEVIEVTDGSFSFFMLNGKIDYYLPVTKHKGYRWRIVSVGEYKLHVGKTSYPRDEKYKFNDMILVDVNNPANILFTNSALACFDKYRVDQIKVGDNVVEFLDDGSIKVGCTTVDADTVKKIAKRVK